MKKVKWKDRFGQLCILAIYLIPYLVYNLSENTHHFSDEMNR